MRTSQLTPPPRLVLPAEVEPQEDYTPVGAMALRTVVEHNGMDRAVHCEDALLGTLTDLLYRRGTPVDAFFSARLACARLAVETMRDHPGNDYVLGTLLGGLPVAVEVYDDVVEVRLATDHELEGS